MYSHVWHILLHNSFRENKENLCQTVLRFYISSLVQWFVSMHLKVLNMQKLLFASFSCKLTSEQVELCQISRIYVRRIASLSFKECSLGALKKYAGRQTIVEWKLPIYHMNATILF